VGFSAFAVAVTMNTPGLFLPFLLTFTGRFTSCCAPHCGPVRRPGVFRVNVAGCDLNWRLCSWLGGAQPEILGLLMLRSEGLGGARGSVWERLINPFRQRVSCGPWGFASVVALVLDATDRDRRSPLRHPCYLGNRRTLSRDGTTPQSPLACSRLSPRALPGGANRFDPRPMVQAGKLPSLTRRWKFKSSGRVALS
jgi:hypothetical protein